MTERQGKIFGKSIKTGGFPKLHGGEDLPSVKVRTRSGSLVHSKTASERAELRKARLERLRKARLKALGVDRDQIEQYHREQVKIISRVVSWAGSFTQARAWFEAQPIPALGGATASALVREGRASAVHRYLDHLEAGGYA